MNEKQQAAMEASLKDMLIQNLGNRLSHELANGMYTRMIEIFAQASKEEEQSSA